MDTEHIERYYDSMPAMRKRYGQVARQDAYRDGDFLAWQKSSRERLGGLIGLDQMERAPLLARTEETVNLENGIVREKVLIQTEEDTWMPMYILIPSLNVVRGKSGRPAVWIALPGHLGAGKYSVAGRYDIPAARDAIEQFHYDYGMKLARMGYVAVCPDCRAFGERREEDRQGDDRDNFLNSSCFQLSHMALMIGRTVAGLCAFDTMCLVDYIDQRGEWDMESLGCMGFSGGGMQTLYAAAMDERIRQVCISGYLYGLHDALFLLNSNCSCNYVPHLAEHFDMGDLASLIAPRPLLVQSCRQDHLNGPRGLQNVEEQMEIVRRAYDRLDAGENLMHDLRDGDHCFHQEAMEEYFPGMQQKTQENGAIQDKNR